MNLSDQTLRSTLLVKNFKFLLCAFNFLICLKVRLTQERVWVVSNDTIMQEKVPFESYALNLKLHAKRQITETSQFEVIHCDRKS